MASNIGELPTARVEKLNKECHANALEFAQDIARNLLIQTTSGASIKGDTGTRGTSGISGKDGKDGKNGNDGKTPTPVYQTADLTDTQTELNSLLPLFTDNGPVINFYWSDTTTPPAGPVPTYYLEEDTTTSVTNIKFSPAVSGASWQIKFFYYELE